MLASGKFLALLCCRRCLACIAAESAVDTYQMICSAVFSCLDWHYSVFILCLASVTRELVLGVPIEMSITMIITILVGKKRR